ncbi:MAG: signal peptidase I [Treponema sp.]|jgi:signal peptidase I|nr:signal peptidase I [Treponema sp.]
MEGGQKIRPGRAILLAFAAALFIKLFFIDFMITQGRSMLPALKPGSVLVVNKAAYGIRVPGAGIYLLRWAVPHEGDMVVFYTPLGERAVKRCSTVDSDGSFYALGDNDLESFDSRSYGAIPPDHVLGKVIAVR